MEDPKDTTTVAKTSCWYDVTNACHVYMGVGKNDKSSVRYKVNYDAGVLEITLTEDAVLSGKERKAFVGSIIYMRRKGVTYMNLLVREDHRNPILRSLFESILGRNSWRNKKSSYRADLAF